MARMSREEKRAQTRRDLLAAAARVFARRGYRGASVVEFAETAGYSHGAVYSNFASKEELFLGVFEDYMAERVRGMEAVRRLDPDAPFPKRARALADQWTQLSTDDRDTFLLNLELAVHAARDPELSRKFGTRSAATKTAVERWLVERETETGRSFGFPPDELATILRALGVGLAVEALNDPASVREGLFGDFVEFVFVLLEERVAAAREA